MTGNCSLPCFVQHFYRSIVQRGAARTFRVRVRVRNMGFFIYFYAGKRSILSSFLKPKCMELNTPSAVVMHILVLLLNRFSIKYNPDNQQSDSETALCDTDVLLIDTDQGWNVLLKHYNLCQVHQR